MGYFLEFHKQLTSLTRHVLDTHSHTQNITHKLDNNIPCTSIVIMACLFNSCAKHYPLNVSIQHEAYT